MIYNCSYGIKQQTNNLTHSFAIGKKTASMKSPSRGPPTSPNTVTAICRRVVPRKGAAKASATVANPNMTAVNRAEGSISLKGQSSKFTTKRSVISLNRPTMGLTSCGHTHTNPRLWTSTQALDCDICTGPRLWKCTHALDCGHPHTGPRLWTYINVLGYGHIKQALDCGHAHML